MMMGHDNMVSEPLIPVVPRMETAMSAAEEERCKVMLDKILAKMDEQGRKMDDMISSLAATTSRLLGAAADSTPSSSSTTDGLATISSGAVAAQPAVNTFDTDTNFMTPTKCSTSGPDPNVDDTKVTTMPLLSGGVPTALQVHVERTKASSPRSFAIGELDTVMAPTCSTFCHNLNTGDVDVTTMTLLETGESKVVLAPMAPPASTCSSNPISTPSVVTQPPPMVWVERHPWPPPVQEEIVCDRAELRPTPWPPLLRFRDGDQRKQRWPPSMPMEIVSKVAELQPTPRSPPTRVNSTRIRTEPWPTSRPSFGCDREDVQPKQPWPPPGRQSVLTEGLRVWPIGNVEEVQCSVLLFLCEVWAWLCRILMQVKGTKRQSELWPAPWPSFGFNRGKVLSKVSWLSPTGKEESSYKTVERLLHSGPTRQGEKFPFLFLVCSLAKFVDKRVLEVIHSDGEQSVSALLDTSFGFEWHNIGTHIAIHSQSLSHLLNSVAVFLLPVDHSNFVNCIRYSPDGSKFISVSSDKKGLIYDGKTGEKIGELSSEGSHTGSIHAVSWSPDSKQVLTVSADKTAKLWDIMEDASGKLNRTLVCPGTGGVDDMLVGCLWQNDYLVTVSLGGTFNLFSASNPDKEPVTFAGHLKTVSALAFFPQSNPRTILSTSYDGVIIRWIQGVGYGGRLMRKNNTQIKCFAAAEEELVTSGYDNKVFRIPLNGDQCGDAESVDVGGQPNALNLAVQQPEFALITTDSGIILLHKSKVTSTTKVNYTITSSVVSPDGTEAVVGAQDGKLRIYSISGDILTEEAVLEKHRGAITSIRYSPDVSMFASADANREAVVWDRATREVKLKNMLYHTARINCLAWSPDNCLVATGSLDTCAIVYEIDKPASSRITIKGAHLGGVHGLTFADNDSLVTAGEDACVRVWKLVQQ